MSRYSRFTKQDDAVIVRMAGEYSAGDIGAALNRTVSAIRSRAHALNVSLKLSPEAFERYQSRGLVKGNKPVNWTTPDQVRKAIALREQGRTLEQIISELGLKLTKQALSQRIQKVNRRGDYQHTTQPPEHYKTCHCKHKLQGTGAIFYQSTGYLYCTICTGWQHINKPIYPNGSKA